jgi:imidazolonepropionase
MKTVALTRAASETELADAARPRLDEMLAGGTTTCEAKSGYGLTTESELTQLRAIHALNRTHTIDIVPTFLGAHDVPTEFKSCRADYVACIVNEMIPRVAAEGLAEWCDVFCDAGYFTPEESRAILDAGRRAGLKAAHPCRPARHERRMRRRCVCGRAFGGSSGSRG